MHKLPRGCEFTPPKKRNKGARLSKRCLIPPVFRQHLLSIEPFRIYREREGDYIKSTAFIEEFIYWNFPMTAYGISRSTDGLTFVPAWPTLHPSDACSYATITGAPSPHTHSSKFWPFWAAQPCNKQQVPEDFNSPPKLRTSAVHKEEFEIVAVAV